VRVLSGRTDRRLERHRPVAVRRAAAALHLYGDHLARLREGCTHACISPIVVSPPWISTRESPDA
jgi:hypothetical protein